MNYIFTHPFKSSYNNFQYFIDDEDKVEKSVY